jgi:hypothetical protein
MKIFYCVSELSDWIDVASYFERENNWEPLLWLTTKKNREYLKSKFPTLSTIDFFEANRGNLDSIKLQKKIPLCQDTLTQYLKYEKIVLKMMDRMDATAYSFNYTQRVQLYYNILEFILNYIEKNQPDIIIFAETPHSVFTYLLYAVAVENSIEILRFSPTHIDGKTFIISSLDSKPKEFDKVYLEIASKQYISQEVEDYLAKINHRYDNAVPYYMKNIINANSRNLSHKLLLSFLKSIEYLFKFKKREGYYKIKNRTIRDSFSNQNLAFSFFRGTIYKIKLQKEYEKYVKLSLNSFDLNKKFIYFPLQYQPEKSTSPEGEFFSDQFLAINMLSKLSQGRFEIYLKEHISQFSPKLKGEQGRVLDFYRELSLLDGVVFVDVKVDSFTLIDKSIAVSTITGTAGFESVVRSKPSIIFGYPWYRDCHGIFFVKNIKLLREFLDQILDGYKVDSKRVKYFLESIFQLSREIYINPSNLIARRDSRHNNQKSIIKLIQRDLQR